jgi:cephalosporin-C deacetylase-like acetyl esterase
VYLSYREPLDIGYFEEALDLLIANPHIDSKNGIGICGISKGGEVSLAMAACLPESKIGPVAVMNTVMNFGIVPAVYKGQIICQCM